MLSFLPLLMNRSFGFHSLSRSLDRLYNILRNRIFQNKRKALSLARLF
ncbi:Hypothetical protein Minf_1481 [Methylacidiphilum infernorum V4]|uniref:Uncharacterized protein n=1 Tax=Methylacidiphilum infernorum (isolate V4) TaxID=481448 RepID=B3DW32_METI4|nr:Hypothetical protein Minf_1481 [Methylacidiphilum infernorum V4]